MVKGSPRRAKKDERRPKGSARENKTDAPLQVARVDDTLVHLHELREELREILAAYKTDDVLEGEVLALAADMEERGELAVSALLDLIQEDDADQRRLIAMILGEMEHPAIEERVRRLVRRPDLDEDLRVSLFAIEALHSDPDRMLESDDPFAAAPDLPLESVLGFAENLWDTMPEEELALMWTQSFAEQPPEQRLAMLQTLTESAHPALVGIARVEIGIGDLKILQFLAERLADFDDVAAGRLLRLLLYHPDLVVRTLAERSLTRWAAEFQYKKSELDRKPFRFSRAYVATDEWQGQYAVFYVVRGRDDLYRCAAIMVDRWDRGIVDCWGRVCEGDEGIRQMIDSLKSDYAFMEFYKAKKAHAITILGKAMGLNIERGHGLPVEFHVWSHLFLDEKGDVDPEVPPFGLDCGICGKPVKTSTQQGPCVVEDLVVCHRCMRKRFACPVCGGKMKMEKCLLTRDRETQRLEIRCPHCYDVINTPS